MAPRYSRPIFAAQRNQPSIDTPLSQPCVGEHVFVPTVVADGFSPTDGNYIMRSTKLPSTLLRGTIVNRTKYCS